MKVQNCTACSIEIDEDNCKKDRKICKKFYNIKRKKYNNNEKKIIYNDPMNNIEKPKINIVNNKIFVLKHENHAYVLFGPRNVGKTYYMIKVLEKLGNIRPIHIIARSPNQYPIYKTSTDIKPIIKYKGSVVILDDMLGARNSPQTDEFFTRGRHEDLDV